MSEGQSVLDLITCVLACDSVTGWFCHWLIYWFSAIVKDHCIFICKGQAVQEKFGLLVT